MGCRSSDGTDVGRVVEHDGVDERHTCDIVGQRT
jgi:hypothetical protein